MNEENATKDLIVRMNYKGILNATTFIEAGLGLVQRRSFKHPVSGDLGPAQYFIDDLAQNIHNSYGNVTDDEKRLDASFKFTKHFETETFGHHEISLGLEYYDMSSDFSSEFSGQRRRSLSGRRLRQRDEIFLRHLEGRRRDADRAPRIRPLQLQQFGAGHRDLSQGQGLLGPLHPDGWASAARPSSVWTDRARRSGPGIWSISFRRASRSIVDLTKDGANVLKLAWGRFSDPITTMPLGFFNPGGSLTYRDYVWTGPADPSDAEIHDPANWAKQLGAADAEVRRRRADSRPISKAASSSNSTGGSAGTGRSRPAMSIPAPRISWKR